LSNTACGNVVAEWTDLSRKNVSEGKEITFFYKGEREREREREREFEFTRESGLKSRTALFMIIKLSQRMKSYKWYKTSEMRYIRG
jgi:hypothetical protein